VNRDAPLPPWWRELFTVSYPIPKKVAEAIVDAGDGGLRAVCAVFDPELAERPVPLATGDALDFCGRMLQRFARPSLVPWLEERLRLDVDDGSRAGQLVDALAACGAPAVESACRWFAGTEPGDEFRPWLADVAARGGVRSDEAFAVVVSHFQDDPIHGAELLRDYGDPAALPALLAEFDRASCVPDDALIVVSVAGAIRALGGELDDARASRLAAIDETVRATAVDQRREFIRRGGLADLPVPEPDEPCVCESGRTYGECCSAAEAKIEAERVELLRLASLRPHRT
jgi:hypothetical protein